MRVEGTDVRTIRFVERPDGLGCPEIIDQTRLPHELRFVRLETLKNVVRAIADMQVRGAPLIGAAAAYGIALAMREDASDGSLARACEALLGCRPTAVNLLWAIDDMRGRLHGLPSDQRVAAAFERADRVAEEDVEICRAIGAHGAAVLRDLAADLPEGEPLQILTHCNAGWLAAVDWGTALAPVYLAHRDGLPLHVWVSETRPRNQGASLTAWELLQEGVPHTVVPDNACGHLMRTGRVDIVITGTDRITAAGDVCNKIGTYLKATAARDCGVPFYVAVPGPSIDWTLDEGQADGIPIEEREATEVAEVRGLAGDGTIQSVRVIPAGSPVANFGFDVTPARLVTGLITDRGVCTPGRTSLAELYPEHEQRNSGQAGVAAGTPN